MRRVPAGAVTFGVEFRVLNEAIATEYLERIGAEQTLSEEDIDTSGVSIHVFGQDGHEYLRFDCFDDGPHYHYVDPKSATQRIIDLDLAAVGDPLSWSLERLRTRLGPMLREAGGAPVAAGLDAGVVATAVDQVEGAAKAIMQRA
jgi:hypothetical protein